jgi:5'-phosphate synthase pdxT subunit
LFKCDSLIIPGGESTTMSLLINQLNLYEPIKKFSITHTLLGTCAGAILMSQCDNDNKVISFNCIDVKSNRNSWGRQINSFKAHINLSDDFEVKSVLGSFIRAPKFIKYGNDCKVIGKYENENVLIRNNLHLISSFHPELDSNLNIPIYKYYLNMINE